jgi:hypothetical protein
VDIENKKGDVGQFADHLGLFDKCSRTVS